MAGCFPGIAAQIERGLMPCALALLMLTASAADAQPVWHAENIALLTGDNYQVDPPRQTTTTLEHVSGWAWGDLFGFVDVTRFHHSDRGAAVYTEWNPRLSLSWLTDRSWSIGPVADVLVATTFEAGSAATETLLIGPGTRLTVPGFDFVNLNLQYALPRSGDSRGWQVTTAWAWRRPVLGTTLVFDGYTDWVVSDRGGNSRNVHFNPQLKLDLGPMLHLPPNRVFAGVEYDYWRNKYGIADSDSFDTTQNTVSAMLQLTF